METERKVWIVMAEVGQYDDHEEWAVAAHLDEGAANGHRDALAAMRDGGKLKACVDAMNVMEAEMEDLEGDAFEAAHVELMKAEKAFVADAAKLMGKGLTYTGRFYDVSFWVEAVPLLDGIPTE